MSDVIRSAMFHTGIAKVSNTYMCDEDCERGGCPTHKVEIITQSTSGTAKVFVDDKEVLSMDSGFGASLFSLLFEFVKKDN